MKIELKNFKSYETMSEETLCFDATVYVDGKKAGTVNNRGCGGPCDFRADDRDVRAAVEAHIESLPPEEYHGDELNYNVDFYFATLAGRHHELKWAKGQCRKKTLFQLKSEEYAHGAWRAINHKIDDGVRKFLADKYGNDVAETLIDNLTVEDTA